jgi:hypothetical protein
MFYGTTLGCNLEDVFSYGFASSRSSENLLTARSTQETLNLYRDLCVLWVATEFFSGCMSCNWWKVVSLTISFASLFVLSEYQGRCNWSRTKPYSRLTENHSVLFSYMFVEHVIHEDDKGWIDTYMHDVISSRLTAIDWNVESELLIL